MTLEENIKAIREIGKNPTNRISKMKKRIAELEQRLEQTEKDLTDYQFNYPKIKDLEQEKCELLGIIQDKDKAIKDLEWQLKEVLEDNDNYQKENAELKEEMKAKQVVLNDFKSRVETVTARFNKKSSQLTKAKDLLNEFMRISKASDEDFEHDYSELIGEAEQFIREVEK